jgi:hypothetical protein
MENKNLQTHEDAPLPPLKQEEDSLSLRGTFASVMTLGILIVLCWAGIYLLYASRL